MVKEVKISHTIGKVHMIRGGNNTIVDATPFKKSVVLKDGDKIITEGGSYVAELSDEPVESDPTQTYTAITIFPNSEIVLTIKPKNQIAKMELLKGLFRITTVEKEVVTPTAELRFTLGGNTFWIDVAKDGAVVVASEVAPMEVVNKKTRKGVSIGFRQQVTVTQEDILEPCEVDQRFKEAYKLAETLQQSKMGFLYGDMLERKVPQELEKTVKEAEEKTGRKEEYDLTKSEKWLKEGKEIGERRTEEAVESRLPEFKPPKVEDKTTPMVKPTITVVDKMVNYQGIDFKITSLEKTGEFTTGKGRLVLNIEAKNNSSRQVIVFPDEEVRLATEIGETISLENYKMETNFDPGTETKGFLLFIVAKESKKFKLQFGKKNLPKVEAEFEITEGSV